MAGRAAVIPFPMHRIRRRLPQHQVFVALFDEARMERAQKRLLVLCAAFAALLGAALEFAVG